MSKNVTNVIEVSADQYSASGRTVLDSRGEEMGVVRQIAYDQSQGFVFLMENPAGELRHLRATDVRLRPIPDYNDDEPTVDYSAENVS